MRKISRYSIQGLLGRGGMSTVYKVAMPVTGKIVSLKLLTPSENLIDLLGKDELIRIFTKEAITLAGLRHPHIIDIRDFDEDAHGRPFYVMEYYCKNIGAMIGENFKVEKNSRIIDPHKAIHYCRQILDGLCCLHQSGIIHRDIKPYNILVTDQDTVKICDFGLSKLHGESRQQPANMKVGSPYYAAPEQEDDSEHVDGRADLYSTGVMFYRMLTGNLPGPSISPGMANPLLDDAWGMFFSQALARKKEDRFSSAKAMLRALAELQDHWEKKKEKACRLFVSTSSVEKQTGQRRPMKLRSKGMKVDPRAGRKIFKLNNLWRPLRYTSSTLKEGGDGTVSDLTSGLLWQQGGSDYPLTWSEAQRFVEQLNRIRAAGRIDWRLPTVDELLSLLIDEASSLENYCIAPMFDRSKKWLWSIDKRSHMAAWYVSVDLGFVGWQDLTCYNYVRAVCSERN